MTGLRAGWRAPMSRGHRPATVLPCTALYAHEHGFPVITSSLGISRWKSMQQINDYGVRAASPYPDMLYWE